MHSVNFLSGHIHRRSLLIAFTCGVLLLLSVTTQANTLVRINTSLGGVTLELFDDVAPVTVNNFLNYVRSDRYDGTVIHRSVPGFVIQGGWLSFDEPAQNFNSLTPDTNIVNEFSLSNTRGTIAMAKVSGDPDSANTQWFINLVDNTELDSINGGFTVFGRVVDNGMGVIDAIAALPRFTLLQGFDPFPLIGFTALPLLDQHLVKLSMAVLENPSVHPNVYDAEAGLLHARVNGGSAGLLSLSFALYSTTPEVRIQALAASLKTPTVVEDNMAIFDSVTNRLTIPEFVIEGAVAFRNVIFDFTDGELLLFTLVSAE